MQSIGTYCMDSGGSRAFIFSHTRKNRQSIIICIFLPTTILQIIKLKLSYFGHSMLKLSFMEKVQWKRKGWPAAMWMNSVIMAMSVPLEDQVKDRPSWKNLHGQLWVKNYLMAYHPSIHPSSLKQGKSNAWNDRGPREGYITCTFIIFTLSTWG